LSVVQPCDGCLQAVETHAVISLGHDDAAVTEEIANLAERHTVFDEPRCVLASEIVEPNR
jgi:hypothetical protein